MQISNESSVRARLDELWGVLNDVERVAPYVPGFELQEVDGDVYRGTVKVKVGAVTIAYNAEIEMLERDVDAHRVVMAVSGRERRGPGSMDASVTSTLSPDGDATRIALSTELKVTGRVAQFGSGVLADVSGSLLKQFVAALEDGVVTAPASAGAPTAPDSPAAQVPRPPRPAPTRPAGGDVIDITGVAGRSVAKRAAPLALAGTAIAVVFYALGRRH